MWTYHEREISKEDYDAILNNEKKPSDFFEIWEMAGYGAIPSQPYKEDGKYYIPYGISDSCD